MSFRMLVMSDIHGNVEAVEIARTYREDVDVAVLSGDIASYGGGRGEEIIKGITQHIGNTVFVIGNCDYPSEFSAEWLQPFNIHGRHKVILGYYFLGLGGSPPSPFHMPFEMPDKELEAILKRAYESLPFEVNSEKLILVSHSPPKKTKLDKIRLGLHVGSEAVRRFIEIAQPILCICGHIHEARGIDKLGRTVLVNPGPAMKGYYALVEISNGKVEVELKRWAK